MALVVKNPPANAGDTRDTGLIPGLERSPGGGHGNALQYSCLENPVDRGAWQAAVHWVTKSWTQSTHIIIKGFWVRCRLRLNGMEWRRNSTLHSITTCAGTLQGCEPGGQPVIPMFSGTQLTLKQVGLGDMRLTMGLMVYLFLQKLGK